MPRAASSRSSPGNFQYSASASWLSPAATCSATRSASALQVTVLVMA